MKVLKQSSATILTNISALIKTFSNPTLFFPGKQNKPEEDSVPREGKGCRGKGKVKTIYATAGHVIYCKNISISCTVNCANKNKNEQ